MIAKVNLANQSTAYASNMKKSPAFKGTVLLSVSKGRYDELLTGLQGLFKDLSREIAKIRFGLSENGRDAILEITSKTSSGGALEKQASELAGKSGFSFDFKA